mmetsp:Transcript_45534/g.74200  ORF Transcript_45534/g.74200 Transcript_45534/m.74200 type:complete len:272 (-) Transcript_45534:177-992(-)
MSGFGFGYSERKLPFERALEASPSPGYVYSLPSFTENPKASPSFGLGNRFSDNRTISPGPGAYALSNVSSDASNLRSSWSVSKISERVPFEASSSTTELYNVHTPSKWSLSRSPSFGVGERFKTQKALTANVVSSSVDGFKPKDAQPSPWGVPAYDSRSQWMKPMDSSPGPIYSVQSSFHAIRVTKTAPKSTSFGFGDRFGKGGSTDSPGPGSYTLRSSIKGALDTTSPSPVDKSLSRSFSSSSGFIDHRRSSQKIQIEGSLRKLHYELSF